MDDGRLTVMGMGDVDGVRWGGGGEGRWDGSGRGVNSGRFVVMVRETLMGWRW